MAVLSIQADTLQRSSEATMTLKVRRCPGSAVSLYSL